MGNKIRQDVARQAANVVGALFQTGMTVAASTTIQGVAAEGPRSLVEPALYAFTIWALIFVAGLRCLPGAARQEGEPAPASHGAFHRGGVRLHRPVVCLRSLEAIRPSPADAPSYLHLPSHRLPSPLTLCSRARAWRRRALADRAASRALPRVGHGGQRR